jgi:ferredoxin
MLFVDKKYCTGCRLCENSCPSNAIRVIYGKAVINANICNECNLCISVCPPSAIKKFTKYPEKNIDSKYDDFSGLKSLMNTLEKKLLNLDIRLNSIENKEGQ